ncbi:hypothetical protein [Thiocapsa sp.]|uniref:hypothetical protein n=1 Tax=Thiocapsa sp. TaxID=2024551 RepID=UPI00359429D3
MIQPDADAGGLVLLQTKHRYLECRCVYGHWTQAEPRCAEAEAEWAVALTERHPAGPTLVALICLLTERMRLSRAGAGIPVRQTRLGSLDCGHQPVRA